MPPSDAIPDSRSLDGLLVLECQSGSEQAMTELFARWQPRFLRHARRWTRDVEAAREVTQEAWLAIVRGLGTLEDPNRFRAWALRIVMRKAVDWVRSMQQKRGLEAELTKDSDAVNPGSGADDSSTTDAVDRVRRALAGLPEETRRLLTLFYLDELSVSEVAIILDIPEGTVKSRLFHARKKLERALSRTKP